MHSLLRLALGVLLVAGFVFAQDQPVNPCAELVDGDSCDDGIADTTGDVCVASVCLGSCPAYSSLNATRDGCACSGGLVMNNGECECVPLVAPALGIVIDCSNTSVSLQLVLTSLTLIHLN
jgi:hypothetical protein